MNIPLPGMLSRKYILVYPLWLVWAYPQENYQCVMETVDREVLYYSPWCSHNGNFKSSHPGQKGRHFGIRPKRRQAIIWNTDDPLRWCISAALGGVKATLLAEAHPEIFGCSWRRACLIQIIIIAMIYWRTTLSSYTGCSFDLIGTYDERITGSIFGCVITTVALHNSLMKCYHLFGHSSKSCCHIFIYVYLWCISKTFSKARLRNPC